MKLSKKTLYSALALTMLTSASIAPVAQTISGMVVRAETVTLKENTDVVPEDRISKTELPEKTTVNVHKIVAKKYNDGVPVTNENGLPLGQDSLNKLGTEVRGLKGVTFSVYRVTEEGLSTLVDSTTGNASQELKNVGTIEAAQKLIESKKIEFVKNYTTSEDGVAVASLNSQITQKDGKKASATYLFLETATPENISSALAVPFTLTLPSSTSSGTGYLKTIDVYPKNIDGEKPKVGKDVSVLGNNIMPMNVNEEISFFLKGSVPTNIQDFTQYTFTDTLDKAIKFVPNSVQVTLGKLTLDSKYYTVEAPSDTNNNTLKVNLTTKGIAYVSEQTTLKERQASMALEIADVSENLDAKPFIQVEFKAKLDASKVIVGKAIENKTKISYNNRSGKGFDPNTPITPPGENTPPTPPTPITPKESDESDKVIVVTGGKTFTKVDAISKDRGLHNAEFEIYPSTENGEKSAKALTWTQELIDLNKAKANQENVSKFGGKVEVGEKIILKSNTDGNFEIAGITLGTVNQKTDREGVTSVTVNGKKIEAAGTQSAADSLPAGVYYLQEMRAPEGYAVNTTPIKFEVTTTSYNKTPSTLTANAADAEPQKVENNKRPEIPNTGGIGTAIFVVIGVAIMAFAAKGMKHHKEEN
ncbi:MULTISPECIES: SpaH/EbpB family LPXTG-anchored major pilin [Streptococcus]|uniref:SpaH/EbpB family LPXTG-anchored major pilin n=1 Tax=Streptococcus TaxID=1301 RepID=UPI0001AAB611|nr:MULTISPECIES: SpaH/EbpB family LPXTG-anchored major pilin [Streptococcus]PXX82890.1 isopeptide-forming domain-containing fimbrial protein [Streptococcus dysgalactiae subsp. equisimilis]VGQ19729.1 fimbrial subunit protein [Streptococcus pyogenes]VGQ61021.1 fimbrial subunit protein [Streptococcus pyogenes]VGU95252.1 fimbrial subunit protein [Streptococcus pyogenes]BAH80675.1 fimbrial subunit protein [Streptococcus dysgalactiae subsp. equisimilis GGS_124]